MKIIGSKREIKNFEFIQNSILYYSGLMGRFKRKLLTPCKRCKGSGMKLQYLVRALPLFTISKRAYSGLCPWCEGGGEVCLSCLMGPSVCGCGCG